MALNINRNVDDLFYRYKMPRLVAKVEGKGNGIKTVIANMSEIAKALNRPPTYPTKYFGCELGAQTNFDHKNERFIVNGEHDAAKLQELLHGFIKKFVLCPECENPETVLTIKGQKINQSCKACGNVGTIDPRHKLTTFILKNPPEHEIADKENPSVTVGKKGKARKGKEQSTPTTEAGGTPATGDKDSDNGHQEGNDETRENSDELEDDWAVSDEDNNGVQDELLSNRIATLTMNADLDKTENERLDMFYSFLLEQKKKAPSLDPKVVVNEADRLDVKEKAVLILCRVLFDGEPAKMLSYIKPNRTLLLRFTMSNKKAQRYLLGGIEQLVGSHKNVLLSKVPHILKAFYDEDIIEESEILDWGDKSSKKYVTKEENKEIRSKAEPFLKWLREAEEESEEESGDDEKDGVEVAFEEDRSKGGTAAKLPSPSTPQPKQNGIVSNDGKQDENDDLNIDDI